MAAQHGFARVSVLQGGLPAWEEQGYAIYAGPQYEKRNADLRYTPQQVVALQKTAPASLLVVDVREPEEFAAKHLPGAINIPAASVRRRLAELDRGKTLIFYCNSGGRSYTVIRHLRRQGYGKVGHVTLEQWEQEGLPLIKP